MNQPGADKKSPTSTLFEEVRDLVLSTVNMHHLDKSNLSPDTPLTLKEGLGLDSIEMLEVVVAVEQRFGVKMESAEDGPKYFRTFGSIAQFIESRRTA